MRFKKLKKNKQEKNTIKVTQKILHVIFGKCMYQYYHFAIHLSSDFKPATTMNNSVFE